MEPSELFVFVWAVIATGFAVYYEHLSRSRGRSMLAMMLGIRYIAEGKAEATIQDGLIRIKEKEDV